MLSGLVLASFSLVQGGGAETSRVQVRDRRTKAKVSVSFLGLFHQPWEPTWGCTPVGSLPGRSLCSLTDLLHLKAWISSAKPLPP